MRRKAGSADSVALTPLDRDRLLSLALTVFAARHRFGSLDEGVRDRIVHARKGLATELPAELHSAIIFFDPAQYNFAGSIEENIVFGKLATHEADARDNVRALIGNVLDELGLRKLVIDIGLRFLRRYGWLSPIPPGATSKGVDGPRPVEASGSTYLQRGHGSS